jgi:RNA polymerase sigma-70 factor (ECF subfamily)
MDDKLIEKVRRRERKAQHILYQQFAAILFKLVYRYVTNEQDAGSIVNIAFFKIFNSIDNFIYRDQKNMLAWMKRITINESLIFLRQRFKYHEIDRCFPEDLIHEDLPDTNLLAEDYYQLIRRLPEDLRTVFNLYAIDGYNHKEIARHLKIKESSSRVYLARARSLLRNYLSENIQVNGKFNR